MLLMGPVVLFMGPQAARLPLSFFFAPAALIAGEPPAVPDYSYLSATIGSTRVARRAGM